MSNIILLELVVVGKVILYQNVMKGNVITGTDHNDPIISKKFGLVSRKGSIYPNKRGIGGLLYSDYEMTLFYISKKGEDFVTNMRFGNIYSKRFKKIAKNYFGNCPDLMDKIKSKYFKRSDIEAVVAYFNKSCGK